MQLLIKNLKYRIEIVLKEQLDSRKLKNKNYSLRALARDVKVSPSTISKIINGKCDISEKMLLSILDSLSLSSEEKEKILFFERCRRLSEFLFAKETELEEAIGPCDLSCYYKKTMNLDKNIIPEVVYYLKMMNEGFFSAVCVLSTLKDSSLHIENTLDIRRETTEI